LLSGPQPGQSGIASGVSCPFLSFGDVLVVVLAARMVVEQATRVVLLIAVSLGVLRSRGVVKRQFGVGSPIAHARIGAASDGTRGAHGGANNTRRVAVCGQRTRTGAARE